MKGFLRAALGMLVFAQVLAVEEGIDYQVLADPQPTETGDKIEVLEVFMYSCPHCFHLEPTIDEWLASKPENAEFLRMPAIFGSRGVSHARAFYAALQMGVIDKFHVPLFRALHERRQRIDGEDALVDFAEAQGIDGVEFRDLYNSFFVNMRVRRAQELVARYGVEGVPSVVVNGKYLTSPSQTGSRDRMVEVIDHLIEIETAAGKATEAAPAAADEGS